MKDEFFKSVDAKIAAAESAKEAKASTYEVQRAASQQAIVDALPVAREYAAGLRERDIPATVSGSGSGFSLEMRWANGAESGLSLYPDMATGLLKVSRISTDHTTGKKFSSSDTFSQAQWSPEKFERTLEGVINDYFSWAHHHDGIGSRN